MKNPITHRAKGPFQWALTLLTLAALGCDDASTSSDPLDTQDAAPGQDAVIQLDGGLDPDVRQPDGALPDGALPDVAELDAANLDASRDAAIPDAAVPDMADVALPDDAGDVALPDAGLPPLIDAGLACMDESTCEPQQNCVDGLCRFDLRPTVYRLSNATVHEPMIAGPELSLALNIGVSAGDLNLLFEPGPYTDDGRYLWFVGNGRQTAGAYVYRHNLPIQNFYGRWRADESATWSQDDVEPFVVNVPAGEVEVEGNRAICWLRFVTNVRLEIWPGVDDAGEPIINATARGYLKRSDAEQVEFRLDGTPISLINYLQDDELTVDSDNDGVNDAYLFALDVVGRPVAFTDEPPDATLSNRDTNPPDTSPEECQSR